MSVNGISLAIRLEREDNIPAFGAFLRAEDQTDKSAVILLNVGAIMAPDVQGEDGESIPMSHEDRKRLLITTLMHEFGHTLEDYFDLPVNEEHIEKACCDWDSAYARGEEASEQPMD